MARPTIIPKDAQQGYAWIDRLSVVLKTLEEMEADERRAAFSFLKSRYSAEWPSDTYT